MRRTNSRTFAGTQTTPPATTPETPETSPETTHPLTDLFYWRNRAQVSDAEQVQRDIEHARTKDPEALFVVPTWLVNSYEWEARWRGYSYQDQGVVMLPGRSDVIGAVEAKLLRISDGHRRMFKAIESMRMACNWLVVGGMMVVSIILWASQSRESVAAR